MKTLRQKSSTVYFLLTGGKPDSDGRKWPVFINTILSCCFLLFLQGQLYAAGEPPASGGATSGSATVCSGSNSGVITLSGQTAAVLRWELTTDAGLTWTPILNNGTSQSYDNLVQTTKYRVAVQNGISSPLYSTISTITVTPAPTAAISYSGSPYCSNLVSASVTRTGTAGGTFSSTSGLSIAPATGKITMASSTAGTYTVTYTVAATGSCPVYTTTTSVTISTAPAATISYAGGPFCQSGGNATVTRTGTAGGTFSSSSGLTIDPVNGSIKPNISTPGTYTVSYTIAAGGGCAALIATTQVVISAAPSATISYSGSPYCGSVLSATVTRTGTANGTYSSTTGLALNALTGKITVSGSTPGTYTVTYTIAATGGCGAYSTTASVSILENPSATIAYTSSPYCTNGGMATVTRTGTAGGVYSSTAGLVISSSTGTINLGASTAGTYSVTYTITPGGGCTIYRKTTSVIISSPLTATISYPGNPYCSDAGFATVTRTGSAIGTYSSDAGLDISSTTGKITLATSVAGSYTVSYTLRSGGCTTVATANVVVNATPSAIISYAGNALCPNGGTATVIRTGTAGGVYSATGGMPINAATGAITLATVPIGNYTITYAIAAGGNCPAFSTSTSITINNPPAAPVGNDQAVCSNGDYTQTLTATASGGTISWYDAATGGNSVASPVQTGPGNVTYYAEALSGGCISATRTPVMLTIHAAPDAPQSNGDQTACSDGTNSQTLTATATSPETILWYDAANNGNNVVPQQTGIGTSTYYAKAFNGTCYSPSATPVTLKINPVMETPGIISGPLNVCPLIGSAVTSTYYISPVTGADFYTWQVPPGATLVSGQGTTTIHVTFDNGLAFTHNMFKVTAESSVACTSAASELEVLKTLPGIPVWINGPLNICEFIGSTANAVYSVDPVENATSYTWAVSGAATIVSGQGTTTVEVQFSDAFNIGNIKVTANSSCGSRAPRSLSISTYTPAMPSSITGANNACPYVGTGTVMTYSVRPAANAISYTWTLPAHMTLLSGQGTGSITVTFDNGYTTAAIKVKSVGSCITSADRSLTVITPGGSKPGPIKGSVNACAFINTGADATYSISRVANAIAYVWIVPAGAGITSHPGGSGVNDTIITVSFNDNLIAGTMISVQAINCIAGNARTLTLTRSLPSKPGLIAGAVNVCPFMSSSSIPAGTPVTYVIPKSVAVQSYSWTAPQHAVISRHPGGTGVNDTILEITYDADFVQGMVSVAAVNGCGAGVVRTISISRSTIGSISNITASQATPCPNRTYTYTLASMPVNANEILWTVPDGADLLSGQGTISITVAYSSASITGAVTAKAYNNCTSGSLRNFSVNLPACPPVSNRMAITAEKITSPAVASNFGAKLFPNPVINEFKIHIATMSQETISIRILDMLGNELKRFVSSTKEITVAVNELQKGAYLVEVTQGENKTVQRLVKL